MLDYIRVKFKEALDKLYKDDYSLIRRRCSERSIVFRMGLYLANSVAECGLDVDCEYNKNVCEPKTLPNRRFNYPDIIVHRREQNESNFLIIEVKIPNDESNSDFENDSNKLIGFTKEAPYTYSLGLHTYVSEDYCILAWYAKGKIQEYCEYKVDYDTHILSLKKSSWKGSAFARWYFDRCSDIV